MHAVCTCWKCQQFVQPPEQLEMRDPTRDEYMIMLTDQDFSKYEIFRYQIYNSENYFITNYFMK